MSHVSQEKNFGRLFCSLSLALFVLTGLFLSFLLVAPRTFLLPLGSSLDHSWQISLYLALKEGLIFGREFVFTYGPLGILTTRMPFPGMSVWYLLTDIFVYANLLLIFIYIFFEKRSWGTPFLLVPVFLIMGTAMYYMELPWLLYFFSLFWTFRFADSEKYSYLSLGLVCSIVNLYVKLNTGLISLVILFGVATVFLVKRGAVGKLFISYLAIIALLGISSLLLPVYLEDYVIASWHIANGYNDAMYLDQPDKLKYFPWATYVLAAFGAATLACIIKIFSSIRSFILWGTISLSLFILFKQGFVRADEHLFAFFEYSPLLFGMWLLLSESKFERYVLSILVLVSAGLSWQAKGLTIYPDILEKKIQKGDEYFSVALEAIENLENDSKIEIPSNARLPESFIKRIGRSTVDIIPHDIASIYFHELAYRPRSVMQSYSAYDEYLDELGSLIYESEDAPRFIIYSESCVDDRYCGFDETRIKRTILKHYKVVAEEEGRLLLQRREYPVEFPVKEMVTVEAALRKPIHIPESDSLEYFRINIDYSLLGKLRRFFYKPEPLFIRFRINGEWTKKYRLIVPIAHGGVLLNRFIRDTKDARNFFDGKFDQLPKVEAIKLSSPNPKMYK